MSGQGKREDGNGGMGEGGRGRGLGRGREVGVVEGGCEERKKGEGQEADPVGPNMERG